MPSDLIFPPTHKPDGFSTDATARRDGSPDPVVRELLQNSLDAAKEALRGTPEDPAEVVFTLSECQWSDIPGADAYRRAFHLAVQERERRQPAGLSVDERRVIQRITTAMSQERIPLLFCRDNGTGIDNMERILFEGNTSKPRRGGGSVGVGHMTAFAASDLRYVLYASRTHNGDIAGGHTILAAYSENRSLRAGDGYYTKEMDLFNYDPGNTSRYQADVPLLLAGQIDLVEDAGSVVCVTGFNNFRNENPPAQEIFRVASANFLVAIQKGYLIITVAGEGDSLEQLSGANIHEYLEQQKHQQRARGNIYFAGSRAFRAYETLSEGYVLDIDDSNIRNCAEIWFRPLPPGDSSATQVNLFRDGMWITTNPAVLEVADFRRFRPFDCVVSLHNERLEETENESDTYHLVRSARRTRTLRLGKAS